MNDEIWNRPSSGSSEPEQPQPSDAPDNALQPTANEPVPPSQGGWTWTRPASAGYETSQPQSPDATNDPQPPAPAPFEPAGLELPARVWSRPAASGDDTDQPQVRAETPQWHQVSPAPSPFAARRPQPGRARGVASFAAVVVLGAVLGAGFITGLDMLRSDDGGSGSVIAPASTSSPSASNGVSTSMVPGVKDVADIYAAVSPSVVEINVTSRGGAGLGSGVVVRDDGLILTNNHVVSGATTIDVVFSDGRTAAAKIVETKPNLDLALIKVDGMSGLTVAKIGDSNALRAGDEIIAIGNPLGLESTVTTGIVSGLNRSLQGGRGEAALTNLIQIDAAVNSGNSGGGLFNMDGELVGIPSAIENPTGQAVFAGVAYAIPIQTALSDLTTLRTL